MIWKGAASWRILSAHPLEAAMKTTAFERFAGVCAILAGIAGFLYSVSFIVLARSAPAAAGLLVPLFLTLSGLLAAGALVGLYQRVQPTEPGFALLALGLGLAGALGAAVHGGYDLSNAINPPLDNVAAAANLPSQIDPRGMLTFGVAGLALFFFSWLIGQGGFSRGLSLLGYVTAALLVVIYLARLIVQQPTNLVLLVPVLLVGFILNPVWYLWLGRSLWQEASQSVMTKSGVRG
jgi:hypothetical protein